MPGLDDPAEAPDWRPAADVGMDRISDLHDALLHNILLRLRSATATARTTYSPVAGATSGSTSPSSSSMAVTRRRQRPRS
jgi:hypothetical protein